MSKVFKLRSVVFFMTITTLFISGTRVWAEQYTVGYVDVVSYSAGLIQVSDQTFVINDLTPIRRHGGDNRLPLSALRSGNLVAMTVRFDSSIEGLRVQSVVLLPNEDVARQYRKSGDGD